VSGGREQKSRNLFTERRERRTWKTGVGGETTWKQQEITLKEAKLVKRDQVQEALKAADEALVSEGKKEKEKKQKREEEEEKSLKRLREAKERRPSSGKTWERSFSRVRGPFSA